MNQLTHYNFGQFCLPNSIWHKLPVYRRSAVFILLFIGQVGEIRVVLTQRSSQLRNFPGHISLPGGKADTGLETEWTTARREMEEEIGIPRDNNILNQQFGCEIDQLNIMPSYLSRTLLAVRPVVGMLRVLDETKYKGLALKLNPGESAGVFSAPLKDFLYPEKELKEGEHLESVKEKELSEENRIQDGCLECIDHEWYQVKWGGIPWALRTFTFPQIVTGEPEWLRSVKNLSDSDDSEDHSSEQEAIGKRPKHSANKKSKKHLSSWGRLGARKDGDLRIYDVWGLTANILHDLAAASYGNPKRNMGDEELIGSLSKSGFLGDTRTSEEKKLIEYQLGDKFGFGDVLPRTEFNRLKRLYKM